MESPVASAVSPTLAGQVPSGRAPVAPTAGREHQTCALWGFCLIYSKYVCMIYNRNCKENCNVYPGSQFCPWYEHSRQERQLWRYFQQRSFQPLEARVYKFTKWGIFADSIFKHEYAVLYFISPGNSYTSHIAAVHVFHSKGEFGLRTAVWRYPSWRSNLRKVWHDTAPLKISIFHQSAFEPAIFRLRGC